MTKYTAEGLAAMIRSNGQSLEQALELFGDVRLSKEKRMALYEQLLEIARSMKAIP